MLAQPVPWFPNSDEIVCDVAEPPELVTPENTMLAQVLRFMARLRMQLRNGPSKGQSFGIVADEDKYAFQPSFDKFDEYLEVAAGAAQEGNSLFLPDVDEQSGLDDQPGHPGMAPNN